MRLRIAAKIGKRINRSLSGFSGISINWLASRTQQMAAIQPAGLPRAAGQVIKRFQPLQLTFSFRKPRIAPFSQRSLNSAKTSKSLRASYVAAPLVSSAPDADCCNRRSGEIITLKRSGRRQNDIRVFRAAVQKHSEITTSSGFCQARTGDWYPDDE